jgi:cell division septal protein FtsQ
MVARAERFAGLWPQVAAAGATASVADLRYSTGFALRRKPGDGPQPKKAADAGQPASANR